MFPGVSCKLKDILPLSFAHCGQHLNSWFDRNLKCNKSEFCNSYSVSGFHSKQTYHAIFHEREVSQMTAYSNDDF